MNKLYVVGECDYDHYKVMAVFAEESPAKELAAVLNRRSKIMQRLYDRVQAKVAIWSEQHQDLYEKNSSEFFDQEFKYKFSLIDPINAMLERLRLKIDRFPLSIMWGGMLYEVEEVLYLTSSEDWKTTNESRST